MTLMFDLIQFHHFFHSNSHNSLSYSIRNLQMDPCNIHISSIDWKSVANHMVCKVHLEFFYAHLHMFNFLNLFSIDMSRICLNKNSYLHMLCTSKLTQSNIKSNEQLSLHQEHLLVLLEKHWLETFRCFPPSNRWC